MTFACSGLGIATTGGVAIGEIYLLQRGHLEVAPRFIPHEEIPDEVDRFRQAVAGARRQLKGVRGKIPETTRSDIVAFIDTHLLMLDDAALVEAPIEHIRTLACSADWALQLQRDALTKVFNEMEDPYLRTRKDDVDHVVNQILKNLLQEEEPKPEEMHGKVILAQDLTPADTILMRHQGISGFITEFGSPMSHTAILARSLDIPAVVGVRHATRCLRHGEQVVVDGELGMVLAAADGAILEHYRQRISSARNEATSLRRLIGQPTETVDHQRVELLANIELPEDIDTTRELGADGVGLYRTEYLYMNRREPPDEEEHFQAYRQVVEGLGGIPVTIRTLDLGADKQIDCSRSQPASNPALGLRAIRLCLKEPRLFMPQLRAILRVAALGPVRMMIPMLSNLQEVHKLKLLLESAREQLRTEEIPFAEQIPLGGMIEVPAAALSADAFAQELDFLSIGTNDLIQYTLAIDRIDDEVNYLYDPLHPSVLRLIQMVIDAGHRHGVPISMCGEMAGDARFVPLLLGMGLRAFSMQPGSLLDAKRTLRATHAGDLLKQVEALLPNLDQPTAAEALALLCNRTR